MRTHPRENGAKQVTTAAQIEEDRERLIGTPVHRNVFPEPAPTPDPMHLHVERIEPLPGTNPSILAGGLGGGVSSR